MLALTEDARDVIEEILEQAEDGAGIRIAPKVDSDGGELQMMVAPIPHKGDQIIESGGREVFVDEAATSLLDDKVLDAHRSAESVQFEILTQAA